MVRSRRMDSVKDVVDEERERVINRILPSKAGFRFS